MFHHPLLQFLLILRRSMIFTLLHPQNQVEGDNIPRIKIGSIYLNYEKRGEGEPMYVLHGGPGFDHRYFGRSLSGLEKFRALYYIDFRGHGKSSKASKKTYTLVTFAEDIEAFRKKMGHGSIGIFGHSMGGSVALLYALRYGQHVNTLILVGTVPKHGGILGHYDLKARLMFLNLKYYLKYRIEKTIDKETFAREILLASWPIYIPRRLLPEFSEYIKSLKGLDIMFDMQKDLQDFNINGDLDTITQPTLLIFGQDDAFLKRGRKLKTIKNSRFSVIPSTRHLPFLEDETYFNIVVREFLTGRIL